jgi:hypothetical protein
VVYTHTFHYLLWYSLLSTRRLKKNRQIYSFHFAMCPPYISDEGWAAGSNSTSTPTSIYSICTRWALLNFFPFASNGRLVGFVFLSFQFYYMGPLLKCQLYQTHTHTRRPADRAREVACGVSVSTCAAIVVQPS